MPNKTPEDLIRELEERIANLEFQFRTAGVGNLYANIDNVKVLRSGQERYNVGIGFFLGEDLGVYKFSLGDPDTDYITWDGTTLTIQGISQVTKRFTAGAALTAGQPVFVAVGTETNNEVQQTTQDAQDETRMDASTDRLGQNFATPATLQFADLKEVRFYFVKTSSPTGSITCSLYATNGSGFPTGAALSTGTIAYADITGAITEYTITMSAYALAASTTYALVLDPGAGVSGANYVAVGFSNAGGLASATIISSTDSGSSWANGGGGTMADGDDLTFKVVTLANAGEVYLTDSSAAATSDSFIGFVKTTTANGGSAPIVISGEATGLSGLSIGSRYYLSDTTGEISTSAGTVTRKVGIALSTTSLQITNIW